MDLNRFYARGNRRIETVEWFTTDDKDRFICLPPKKEKKFMNFKITEWTGCIPHFDSKTAGVTMDGRDDIIRIAKSKIENVPKAKPCIRLIRDTNNPHHKDAIKVILSIKSGKDVIMKERHVGFIPAKLANFLRFAGDHHINYNCVKANITTSSKWVSIAMTLAPDILSGTKKVKKPIRTPMIKKNITGETVEDFRNALLKTKKKRNR